MRPIALIVLSVCLAIIGVVLILTIRALVHLAMSGADGAGMATATLLMLGGGVLANAIRWAWTIIFPDNP